MTTWITICDTCKREDWDATSNPLTDGEVLAALIEERAEGSVVKTRRVSCLMGCDNSCNVAIQADGKLAYTLRRGLWTMPRPMQLAHQVRCPIANGHRL